MEREIHSCPCDPAGGSAGGETGVPEEAVGRTKERSEKEYRDLMNRLSRIEGQIRGIRGMVERGAYCTDILTQVAAATSALNSFNKVLLANHMKTCVMRDIKEGREEAVDEVLEVLQKLMRDPAPDPA